MAYASTDQVISWIRLDTGLTVDQTAARVAELTRLTEAADEIIDAHCNRSFGSTTEVRTFYPPYGQRTLFVGDVQSVTGITEGTDDTTVDSDGFRVGSGSSHPSDRPDAYIERLGGNSWMSPVKVTGVWGFAQVPAAVTQAAIMITARLYQRSKSPTGSVELINTGGHYIRSIDPDIAGLLAVWALPIMA